MEEEASQGVGFQMARALFCAKIKSDIIAKFKEQGKNL